MSYVVTGFNTKTCTYASRHLIPWLYGDRIPAIQPINGLTPKKTPRNEEIKHRFKEGEPATDLAKLFGISLARIYQIIHGLRK